MMGHRRISNKRVKQMISDVFPDDFNNQEEILVESQQQDEINDLPEESKE